MFLRSLSVSQFKNVAAAQVAPARGITCFTGPNGVGKTNLLDAIYYLCMAKSYFGVPDAQLVQRGTNWFSLVGEFCEPDDAPPERISCGLKIGGKKAVKANGTEYPRLADHIGRFPVVLASPTDTELILDGSEVRRRFMDAFVSQIDHSYLEALIRHNRLLNERNSLLKQAFGRSIDNVLWDVLDEQMAPLGSAIHARRSAFVAQFAPVFSAQYQTLADGAEVPELLYESPLHNTDYSELLHRNRYTDREAGRTTQGPHRDDLLFGMQGMPVRKHSSQGQQKTFLLALKLAQHTLLLNVKGIAPLLLLDDVVEKLDRHRLGRLLAYVQAHPTAQTFITHTEDETLHKLFDATAEVKYIAVAG